MEKQEIQKIYQENPKYVRELDPTTVDYSRLLIETIEWKNPHLMHAVPGWFNPSSVAEIGCFCGHIIGNILVNGKSDFSRHGYDINHDAIKSARTKYPNVEFFCADVFESGKTFDLLILSDIVEHIEDDVGFLKRCKEISQAVVLNLPLEKSISTAKREYGFSDPSGHLRAYDLKDALNILERCGFSIVSQHTTCVFNSSVVEKVKALSPVEDRTPALKRAKRSVIESLQQWRLFNKFYYGSNLFTFLFSN